MAVRSRDREYEFDFILRHAGSEKAPANSLLDMADMGRGRARLVMLAVEHAGQKEHDQRQARARSQRRAFSMAIWSITTPYLEKIGSSVESVGNVWLR
jgi:hypothetical protein